MHKLSIIGVYGNGRKVEVYHLTTRQYFRKFDEEKLLQEVYKSQYNDFKKSFCDLLEDGKFKQLIVQCITEKENYRYTIYVKKFNLTRGLEYHFKIDAFHKICCHVNEALKVFHKLP